MFLQDTLLLLLFLSDVVVAKSKKQNEQHFRRVRFVKKTYNNKDDTKERIPTYRARVKKVF